MKTLVLVDGENIVERFTAAIGDKRYDPDVVYDGELLWHKDFSPVN